MPELIRDSSNFSYSIEIGIEGMTCNHCVNTIKKALEEYSGSVSGSVEVSLDQSKAILKYENTENNTENDLKDAFTELIENLGYEATSLILVRINQSDCHEAYEELQVKISVYGMTCSHCTNTVQKALQTFPFIDPESVCVSLEKEQATMVYHGSNYTSDKDEIKAKIEDLGYDVGNVTLNTELPELNDYEAKCMVLSISGMTCQHCTQTVSNALEELPGTITGSVDVSLEKKQARFSFEGSVIDAEVVKELIENLGYDLNGKPRIKQDSGRELSKSYTSQLSITMPNDNSVVQLNDNNCDDGGKRKVVMRVLGMTCKSCVASVTDALENEIPNVQPGSIHVNLQTEMAMFICTNPDIDFIHTVIEERGFDVENVQIIHNLIPPVVLLSRQQQQRQGSIVSLVSVESQTVSVPHKVRFQISGMTCASCVRTVEEGLRKLPGVNPSSVQVNLLTQTGSLSVYGSFLDEKSLVKAIKKMGYKASKVSFISELQASDIQTASNAIYKANMIIVGMFCANCVEKTYGALKKLLGIRSQSIQIDLESGKASFEFTGELITRQKIYQAILQIGFTAESIKIKKMANEFPSDNDSSSIRSQGTIQIVSTHLVVTGMTCSSCVANIERTMMKQNGVTSCQVNLLAKSAVIQHDPNVVGSRSLAQMIEQIGYKAELSADKQGDTILEQRESMRESMNKELAILKSRFLWSLLFAIPVVLISMIFMMALPASSPVHRAFMKQITHGLSIGDLILFLLATPVQFWLGKPFYTKAYKSLVYAHTANMETLVAMGTTVAYFASVASVVAAMVRKTAGAMSLNYFETSVLLITFIHFGKWLEALAKGKTAETITKLMDLQPEKAILIETQRDDVESSAARDGDGNFVDRIVSEREIESKDIQVGDILKINAGGRIPCDGKVWRGSSTADESMITGESIPVIKNKGDNVITATINLTAPIYVRAVRVGSDTTLSRIIQLVQDAQASPKAPIEQMADNISSIFVPIVILLALITFIVWEVLSIKNMYPDSWLPAGENKTLFSLMLAVTVLVIACPCGLGLASPTAVMVGTGVAAKYGVLIKGGGYALEMANRITTVAFDKTGTLTMGKPLVTHVWIDQSGPEKTKDNTAGQRITMWKILGCVSSASNHPLSKSIEKKSRYIIEQLLENPSISDIELLANDVIGSEQEEEEESDTSRPSKDINHFEGVMITNAQEIPGRGLLATITLSSDLSCNLAGRLQNVRALNVFLGNQEWMDENHARYQNSYQTRTCHNLLTDWQNLGQSIVMVSASPVSDNDREPSSADNHKEGCRNDCACDVCHCATSSLCCSASRTMMMAQLAIADIPRPEAMQLISELQERNIEVWMITGDNERTGSAVGKQLGINSDHVLAGVKPEQKADKIRNLQRRGIRSSEQQNHNFSKHYRRLRKHENAVVAMVGDGINDSPALAQADV
ncbi:Copper-transporting ATPase 2, partial [Choanephora cucurbitarum]